MSAMEQTTSQSRVQKIYHWLIPLAGIVVFAIWFYNSPPGLLGKADAIGYAICHRIDERSFHMGERQLPLCARCTGEFYAAGLTLLFLSITSPKKSGMPGWKLGAPLIFFLLAFGIDGSNSYLYLLKQTSDGALSNIPNLYIPNNTLRLFTGSGMGIALASILFPAFNQSAWKAYDSGPALTWKQLVALIGIVLVINLLILTENELILYPIALFSVLGVLTLLIMVFSMAWVLMMREENAFDSLTQMWMPFLAGTTLAFMLITVIDVLRFKLTGTWGGFPLS
jgi:uncharacterized membrane protein